MIRFSPLLFILALAIYLFSLPAFAQEVSILNQQIEDDGKVYEVQLGSADTALKTINLWFLSKGNDTRHINSYFEGPVGLKLSVKAKAVRNKALAQAALEVERGFWDIKLHDSASTTERSTFVMKSPGTAAASDPFNLDIFGGGTFNLCELIPASELKSLLTYYSLILGRPATKEDICSPIDTGIPDPINDPDNPFKSNTAGLQLAGIFHKDACAAEKKSLYLVKIELDLSGVDPALFAEGFKISAGMGSRRYKGQTASTIKPVSDGRFAPKPLLLMSTLGGGFFLGGGGGGEKVEIRRWGKNGPPKKPTNLKVYDYVFYKNLMLTRSPLVGLNGGRATFTLTNGNQAYGVCFALERRRQKSPGYP